MSDALLYLERIIEDGSLNRSIELQRHGQALDDALQSVDKVMSKVQALEHLAQVTEGLGGMFDAASSTKVVETATELKGVGDKVAKAAGRTDALKNLNYDLHQAGSAIDRLEELFKSAWQVQVEREFGNFAKLERLVRKCLPESDLADRIKEISSKGLQLKNPFPPGESQLAQRPILKLERDTILQELADSGAGEDLVTFLFVLSEGAATLEALKPDLIRWLSERHLLGLFEVTLA
jgi:hypothetical protein